MKTDLFLNTLLFFFFPWTTQKLLFTIMLPHTETCTHEKHSRNTHTQTNITFNSKRRTIFFSSTFSASLFSSHNLSTTKIGFDFYSKYWCCCCCCYEFTLSYTSFSSPLFHCLWFCFVSSGLFHSSNNTFRCWMFIDFSYVALQYDVVEFRIAEFIFGLFGGFFGPRYFFIPIFAII